MRAPLIRLFLALALLFSLALALAPQARVLALPTGPSIPRAGVREVPPPPPDPFPEYKECVRWLAQEGHAESPIESWTRRELGRGFSIVRIAVRCWSGVPWVYHFFFDASGRLKSLEYASPACWGQLFPLPATYNFHDLRYHHRGRAGDM